MMPLCLLSPLSLVIKVIITIVTGDTRDYHLPAGDNPFLSPRPPVGSRDNPLIGYPSDWLWSRPAFPAAAPQPPGRLMWPGRDSRWLMSFEFWNSHTIWVEV